MTTTTLQSTDRSVIRAVAVGSGAQLLGKVAHLGLNIVASLALIRYLGPTGYGDYAFVFGFSTLFGLLSDFGIPKIAVRDMARDPNAAPAVLGTAIVMRLALAAASLVVAQMVLALFGLRPGLSTVIGVASLLFVTDALLSVGVVFQVNLVMQYDALVTVTAQAIDTALILWLIANNGTLLQIVAAPVFAGAVGVAIAAVLARGRFRSRLAVDFRRMPYLFRAAAPAGLTLLLAVAYLKLDNVLLGIMATPQDVGLYAAAYKPIEYLLLAAGVVVLPIYPLLARWHGVDSVRFEIAQSRGLQALLAMVFPVPVLMAFLAPSVLRSVYAADFAAAETPLRILAVALVFMYINGWQGFTLLAAGQVRVTLLYDAAGLLVNVILNLVLIPMLSYVGAALAALLTSIFISCAATVAVHRLTRVGVRVRGLGAVLLAGSVLGGVLWGLLAVGTPWLVAMVVATLTYPAWLLVCRVTTLDELRLLPSQRSAGPALELG